MTRVRIKDIAEIANVSAGTVDRVIHNRGEVSARTRERIEQLLAEYNYQPDIAARSLALKREIHLAVVMPRAGKEHSFWDLPRQGLEKALESLDQHQIRLHHFYFDQMDPAGFSAMAEAFPFDRVEGLLFAPVFREESLEFMERCDLEHIPVILFNSFLEASPVRSFVGQDAYASGNVAARLMDYGLPPGSDVAIVNMSARLGHYTHVIERERGFREYFSFRKDRLGHLISIDLNGADDQLFIEKLKELASARLFAGFFVTNSRVHKVARFLEETGQKGIRLVGYDLLPENIRYLKQGLIDFLISQKPEVQAFQGLRSLFDLVVFKRETETRQWIPIDIITRENLSYYQPKSYS